MLSIHWPRAHTSQVNVTRLRIIIKRIPRRPPPLSILRTHPRRRRQIHRIAVRPQPTTTMIRRVAAHTTPIRSTAAIVVVDVAAAVQSQLLLLIVAARPTKVVRLVADARVPRLVWVERAEAAAAAGVGCAGRALVGAGGGAVVAVLELACLV